MDVEMEHQWRPLSLVYWRKLYGSSQLASPDWNGMTWNGHFGMMLISSWLVVWNMFNDVPYIGNNNTRKTDFHIFQRGRYTTNQYLISLSLWISESPNDPKSTWKLWMRRAFFSADLWRRREGYPLFARSSRFLTRETMGLQCPFPEWLLLSWFHVVFNAALLTRILGPFHLVGGLGHFLCFHILGIIIPTDEHIFRGVETTNQ